MKVRVIGSSNLKVSKPRVPGVEHSLQRANQYASAFLDHSFRMGYRDEGLVRSEYLRIFGKSLKTNADIALARVKITDELQIRGWKEQNFIVPDRVLKRREQLEDLNWDDLDDNNRFNIRIARDSRDAYSADRKSPNMYARQGMEHGALVVVTYGGKEYKGTVIKVKAKKGIKVLLDGTKERKYFDHGMVTLLTDKKEEEQMAKKVKEEEAEEEVSFKKGDKVTNGKITGVVLKVKPRKGEAKVLFEKDEKKVRKYFKMKDLQAA